MLKSFKHIIIVVLTMVIHFETVAQSSIYKDVLLDGKPAKLNTVTGEVVLVTEFERIVALDTITHSIPERTSKDSLLVRKEGSEVKTKTESATTFVYELAEQEKKSLKTDYHTVQKGETLYSLSKRYGASLGELKRANNLETTLIKTGQVLRVANFDKLYESDTWVVVKGDTLYNIAKRTNTTVGELKTLNNLSSNLIKIGQVLRLK